MPTPSRPRQLWNRLSSATVTALGQLTRHLFKQPAPTTTPDPWDSFTTPDKNGNVTISTTLVMPAQLAQACRTFGQKNGLTLDDFITLTGRTGIELTLAQGQGQRVELCDADENRTTLNLSERKSRAVYCNLVERLGVHSKTPAAFDYPKRPPTRNTPR